MEINVNNLSYKVDNNIILFAIDATFKDNKISSLIGPAGSGKTTLLDILSCSLKMTSGSLFYSNYEVNSKTKKKDLNSLYRNIGYVCQSPWDQVYNQTVLKELNASLKGYGLSKESKIELIEEIIREFDINRELLDKNPYEIGQCNLKKLALASVIIKRPKLLLLDDPTAGLDYSSKKNLVKFLKKLKRNFDITIIIASNDVDFLNQVTDEIFVVKQGRIILSGTRLEVFKQEEYLNNNGIKIPKIISFENLVYRDKKIKIGYRDDVNDLIKDVYRNAK